VNAVWRTPTLRFDHFLHETHPHTCYVLEYQKSTFVQSTTTMH
jgi:hypothetical protein